MSSIFKDGKILCAIIHHYRPDLLDYNAIKNDESAKNNQLAIDILEKELGIPPVMTGEEITKTEDYLTTATYLTEVYDLFRGEIPHVKHPKLELPESTKMSDLSYKTVKTTTANQYAAAFGGPTPARPSSRHKRHAEPVTSKASTIDKKTRKRRTLEKIGASVDHETKVSTPSVRPGGTDEDLAARIKSLENKWRDPQPTDKKPKDLMRAIGKIETSDWNIKEIEKKIQENKMGKPKTYDKEKVPKWSKEQFIARQTKMEKKHYTRQDSAEAKFAEIDKSIKNLDQKLKEGTIRELGTNKVATITEKLANKVPAEPKPPEKTQVAPRAPVVLPPQGVSELCHFCGKRVYLMERLSAEGRFFHHGCFKCQYCNMQLRLGSYAFDRDGMYGFKFFCQNHFGMVGEPPKIARRPPSKTPNRKSPEKRIPQIAGVDLGGRRLTKERPESAAHSTDHVSSDQEDLLSQMDEDEWTDKNFGASCAEVGDSDDDDSSSLSDTDSDDEDAYDDALEEPVTKEGTMKWAERLRNSYSRKRHESDSDSYSSSDYSYENSSDDDNVDTATEGEEEIRARELRRQEVRVEPPVVQTDTGTDTEVVSDESSSESSSEIQNSATEISTDSEFAQDDPTPTREVPSIVLNDFHVTKVRGSRGNNVPKKIQVTTGYLQRPTHDRPKKPTIELNLKPLVPHTPLVKKPAPVLLPRTEGYALNRTQSTGGIAAKVSLELKKKYLLGESNTGSIQKSGSASTLDTTFKTFHSKISDCQKLLKPAPEISASMQTFCNKLNERKSPVLSPQSSMIFPKNIPEPTKEEEPSKSVENIFENESEGRPRSPVHETSIIVPNIDWNKKEQSLSSDSLATSSSEDEISSKPKFDNIPRVEVHSAIDVEEKEDIPLDSLIVEQLTPAQSETTKSITSDKKSLNQPKQLPNLEILLPDIHNALHVKNHKQDLPETEALKNSSGLSSPESGGEQPTTALTETELSDWARDEVVSDSFEDADFESEKQEKQKDTNISAKIAKIAEFDDLGHVCGKENATMAFKNKTILTEAMNNILGSNLDNIEFMDTGTETSSEDGQADSQNGYILLKNEDEFAEDSLNPNINEIVEATNIHILDKGEMKNSGYCIIAEDIKQVNKSKHIDHEDDSLLHVETGTTTEENTCSDSTVKNVTEITADKKQLEVENNNIQEVEINNEQNKNEQNKSSQKDTIEYSEHCQRLQSKIEFSNAKDSIDVRKSRRKSKSEAIQKPDLIQEEVSETQKEVTLKLTPTPHTPDILYRKDIIQKERDVNQKLVQEMVMNKMLAEHKSLERKRRNRLSQSPYSLTKSATTDIVSQINLNNLDSNRQSTYSTSSSTYNTPDVLLSTNLIPLQNSKSMNTMPELTMSTDSLNIPVKEQNRPTSLYASFTDKSKMDDKKSVDVVTEETPKAPPRQHRSADEVNRKLEKLKQSVKARGKENESQTMIENERNNSWVYSNDTLNKKKNAFKRSKSGDYGSHVNDNTTSVPVRTKSIPELQKKAVQIHNIEYEIDKNKIFKSDPNILESDQKNKKKSKDRERRKSITKMITSLFTKKSPTSGSKGLFSKLSPKSKDISKSCANLDLKNAVSEEPVRRKSLSEANIARNVVTPPPIPPLPANYSVKATDESSDGEYENKIYGHSSCDTLDQSGLVDNSMSSLNSRRSTRSKKAIRHAQRSLAKRHRMAQEIQRKLEETEVKTKELERRGVEVEKALRGEDGGACSKDESELLQEWFDLMRDRTELRRYEKELTIRAQELELEDRHARLQHQLREKLESGCEKTEEDLKVEKSIIKEMMNIVAQRDSLVAAIEEERLRCTTEDRDLEEQMLAKGLRLTPIKVSPEK